MSSSGAPIGVTRMRPSSRSMNPSSTRLSIRSRSSSPAADLERARVDALAEAQAHQQELVALLLAGQRLVLDEAVALALDLGQPHFRMSLGLLREPSLRRDEAPMRARTDARIFAVAPVDEVVPALAARARVVGDLIGRQAARLGQFPRRFEQREAQFLVGQFELAGVAQALEDRVRLDGQLIERDVVAGELSASASSRARRPRSGPAARRSGRKLKRGKSEAASPHRRQRLVDGVLAPERLEVGVVQRLHADRDPVDAGGAIAAKTLRLDAGRVGLEGDLGVGLEAPGGRSRR